MEYLKTLREPNDMTHKAKKLKINVGDVVMIKGNDKKRGTSNHT